MQYLVTETAAAAAAAAADDPSEYSGYHAPEPLILSITLLLLILLMPWPQQAGKAVMIRGVVFERAWSF